MKRYIFVLQLLFSLLCVTNTYAQDDGGPYEDLWQKVDYYVQYRFLDSARQVVQEIYETAKEDLQDIERVRAVRGLVEFNSVLLSNADTTNISFLKQEIIENIPPFKAVVQSYLANYYYRYYQRNRWKILGRSRTDNPSTDFAFWDATQFHKEITELYHRSLKDAERLANISAREYRGLTKLAENSQRYRPTFYDILVQEALTYFNNSESSITRPADQFEVKATKELFSWEDFLKMDLSTQDTLSSKWLILSNYQMLTKIHDELTRRNRKQNIVAFVDGELHRLEYVRNNSFGNDKDSLYMEALENLKVEFQSTEVVTEVYYKIAKLYHNRGINNPSYKSDIRIAREICADAISLFPYSYGAQLCKELRVLIDRKELSFIVESINTANKPFRARLDYKNVDKVHYRIVESKKSLQKNFSYSEKYIKQLLKEKVLASGTFDLRTFNDYRSHSTELMLPELSSGKYYILIGNDAEFRTQKHAVALAQTTVRGLAYSYVKDENENLQLHVVDRDSGLPLEGVIIKHKKRGANVKYKTHANGEVTILAPPKRDRRSRFKFKTPTEKYVTSRIEQEVPQEYKESSRQVTKFFTDRMIYRPGQTIYFKGISLTRKGDQYTISPDQSVTVYLYDPNYQKVAELSLVSNEYGTFSGTFTAPTKGLLGRMEIRSSGGSLYFSVEEYKRPKFEVEFQDVVGSYRVNDKVTVKGNAVAYSGAKIDQAKVKYRVYRTAYFPYWQYEHWGRPNPHSARVEIKSGVVTTDAKGEYSIEFEALPDKLLSPEDKPVFTYNISVDVTDLTGETRSASTSLRVGYIALELGADVPSPIYTKEIPKMSLYTLNLSGQFAPAKGTYTFTHLVPPANTLRKRQWSEVDAQIQPKTAYKNVFPHDVYANENQYQSWLDGDWTYTAEFETKEDDKESQQIFVRELKLAPQGMYRLDIESKDKYGNPVKISKYFMLENLDEKLPPTPQVLYTHLSDDYVEPNDKVILTIGTSEPELHVVYELMQEKTLLDRQYLTIKKGKYEIPIKIKESHRGNIQVHLNSICHNDAQNKTLTIHVPWTNKELDVEWMTFRSKLSPGQKEQWKLKLSGPRSDKVAAEMVAALYDASLDAFRANSYDLSLNPYYSYRGYGYTWRITPDFNTNNSRLTSLEWNFSYAAPRKAYDVLHLPGYMYDIPASYSISGTTAGLTTELEEVRVTSRTQPIYEMIAVTAGSKTKRSKSKKLAKSSDKDGIADLFDAEPQAAKPTAPLSEDAPLSPPEPEVKIRKNLNETAFFFPHLQTNEEGEIIIDFTIPEALTKWKFISLAHTKDLKIGTFIQEDIVTQKELMVNPFTPRFLREGDKVYFSSKINNLTKKDLSGKAELRILDAKTMQPVTNFLRSRSNETNFTVKKGQSTLVQWELAIPDDIDAVVTQIIAKAGNFSDGEENALPVLKNRMLVTESLPLPINGNETKDFTFNKLLKSDGMIGMKHHSFSLEFTSNPAWYAVQSLPYLMEFPYECTEQIFSRFYANALATHIANSNPKIEEIFAAWADTTQEDGGRNALLSNLEQNQELKAVLLEETPWVMAAQNESERKKRVGLLFDLNRMKKANASALKKLSQRQKPNGSFSWFPGMGSSPYITTLIAIGFGDLHKMKVQQLRDSKLVNIGNRAINYLDRDMYDSYKYMLRQLPDLDTSKNQLSRSTIQYLYARSFYPSNSVTSSQREAYNYWMRQAKAHWPKQSPYMQGMLAIVMARAGKQDIAEIIIASLKDRAINDEELGMYWKHPKGYFWYQAPVETQSLLIQAFNEVGGQQKAVEDMKKWLLKEKQTHNWESTRATVAACNALLMTGNDLLEATELVTVTLGGERIKPQYDADTYVEPGTGYFKKAWEGKEVKKNMGNITVSKSNSGIGWGAAYWQYFQPLDRITYATTPLKINKELFIKKNAASGPILTKVRDGNSIQQGDEVVVRIEITVDREMEYVHLKDMRASGFEPINVFSGYRSQGRIGYYESTKDAATHFFMDRLPKGKHVFEYSLRAVHKGDFSNGVAFMQSMYAPEFTSHSNGIRVRIR